MKQGVEIWNSNFKLFWKKKKNSFVKKKKKELNTVGFAANSTVLKMIVLVQEK